MHDSIMLSSLGKTIALPSLYSSQRPRSWHTHVVEAPITDEGLERERRRRRENGL